VEIHRWQRFELLEVLEALLAIDRSAADATPDPNPDEADQDLAETGSAHTHDPFRAGEPTTSDSVRAWAGVARMTTELIAEGRFIPSAGPGGLDRWLPTDLDRFVRMEIQTRAQHMPLAAHGLIGDPASGGPASLDAPLASISAFIAAVVDSLPRAPGSASLAERVFPLHRQGEESVDDHAFGDRDRLDVGAASAWFSPSEVAPRRPLVGLHVQALPSGAGGIGLLMLHHRHDPSLSIRADELWRHPSSVAQVFDGAEVEVLRRLKRASSVWSGIVPLLEMERPDRLDLDDDEVIHLLGLGGDELEKAGVHITWDDALVHPLEIRRVLDQSDGAPPEDTRAIAGIDAELELSWQALVEDRELTEDELDELLSSIHGMTWVGDRLVRPPLDQLARLRRTDSITPATAIAIALGGDLVIDGEIIPIEIDGPLTTLANRLGDLETRHEMDEPEGLIATLRPYQRRGLAWLCEMAHLGLGGVLADDMGLGKTIQVLALHLHRSRDPELRKPTLVVCPASLLGNWERETARFTPEIKSHRYHGASRSLEGLANTDIVVTTYGVVARDAAVLDSISWGLVVADEAQAIKNPKSSRARSIRLIGKGSRIALTGTPVENRLTDLWAILDWTTPGLLGRLSRFRREIVNPVEKERDPAATAAFARAVRPFVLRRRKSDPDIVPDLPPKTETDRFVTLTEEQTELYQTVLDTQMAEISMAEGKSRRGLVFKLITGLKQVCNHPAHYLRETEPLGGRSGKLEATIALLELIKESNSAALIFTQYVTMGDLLQSHLEKKGFSTLFLHGSQTVNHREQLVDRFQAGEADAFILSLTAGGTGLNLTAATHVIHYDRWWNPAVEDQASDRAWRIGQDQPVQIHRLICEGTIEDRIAALSASKRQLAGDVVAGGETWLSDLSDEDLHTLVRLAGPGDDDLDEFDFVDESAPGPTSLTGDVPTW